MTPQCLCHFCCLSLCSADAMGCKFGLAKLVEAEEKGKGANGAIRCDASRAYTSLSLKAIKYIGSGETLLYSMRGH